MSLPRRFGVEFAWFMGGIFYVLVKLGILMYSLFFFVEMWVVERRVGGSFLRFLEGGSFFFMFRDGLSFFF